MSVHFFKNILNILHDGSFALGELIKLSRCSTETVKKFSLKHYFLNRARIGKVSMTDLRIDMEE